MHLSDLIEAVALLDREQAIQVGDAVRARLKAIREADPYYYVIERVHRVGTKSFSPHTTHYSYSTWSQGQICFFAETIDEYGGIARGKELSKNGGSGLAFWSSRSQAVDYLNWTRERLKENSQRCFRIREIDKATGKLCDFEEQLVKATEGLT